MDFYETTLRKVFENVEGIENVKYVGRSCIADVGGGKVMKGQFSQSGIMGGRKDSLTVNILSKNDGKIDSTLIRFEDIWPQRYNICGSKEGPHIGTYNGVAQWYTPEPSKADYMKLSSTVSDYVSFFTELNIEQNEGMSGMEM